MCEGCKSSFTDTIDYKLVQKENPRVSMFTKHLQVSQCHFLILPVAALKYLFGVKHRHWVPNWGRFLELWFPPFLLMEPDTAVKKD